MTTAPATHASPTDGPSTRAREPEGGSLGPDDPRAVFARAVALAGATIGEVRPDQLDHPTACTEFDVRALLGHLAGVVRRVAAMGRGEEPMAVPATTEGVPDYGWPAVWVERAHEVQAAWTDEASLTRMVRLPWATFPGAAALALYTGEVTLHTWDLATATGQWPAWNDQVLSVAFDALRRALPAEGRTAEFEKVRRNMPPGVAVGGPPFGEAAEIAPDAPLIDCLVAWSGRQP